MDTRKSGFWNWIDGLQGDKVVWMIALLLIMISIVAVSGSTSLLAIMNKRGSTAALDVTDFRLAIIREQFVVATLGIIVIVLIYNVRNMKWFWNLSQYMFWLSFLLLAYLDMHLKLPGFKSIFSNGAWRIIEVGGKFQINVFEVVKVGMTMYMAWALQAYENDDLPFAERLAKNKRYAFMSKPFAKRAFYIYLPMGIIMALVIGGSLSAAIIIILIMTAMALIGGLGKEIFAVGAILAVLGLGCYGVFKISDGRMFSHLGTAVGRIGQDRETEVAQKVGTTDFKKLVDEHLQPISAKIAVKEGGLTGKGPGKSTQKYVVALMFEDYMFAFIVEEYGWLGAIVILTLYVSLLARGITIVKYSENTFAKTAIAGLILLISGQAMLHILVNVDIGPMTGQTLPMVSHGKFSFLMFSIAFGIILAMSRLAKKNIEMATMEAGEQKEKI